MARIDVERLTKTFQSIKGETVEAIRDVSVAVGDNEFVSIVGPSGCGKSTLLYIIAGFVAPTAGAVLVDGKPVRGPGPDRGIVFQEYALFPWRTVQDNIKYGLEEKGVPSDEMERIVRRYVRLMGLEGFQHKYPKELSGGMKQRVALARTLAYEPDVLLMDEPFGALDAQTRELQQDELLAIWREKKTTVLFVTHSVEEAVYLSEKVVVMTARPGRIKSIVDVDLDRSRHREDVVTSAVFERLRNRVWLDVREEVLKHHALSTDQFGRDRSD
ncbi:MAG TPA: ABC transporter ATP-binding protein [Candidatus Methylomirabilis sp.]|nr:ABC transporter ATP-binding protein [Candidatus Methylomirabilis sp.]